MKYEPSYLNQKKDLLSDSIDSEKDLKDNPAMRNNTKDLENQILYKHILRMNKNGK